jgi:hypothetical protein
MHAVQFNIIHNITKTNLVTASANATFLLNLIRIAKLTPKMSKDAIFKHVLSIAITFELFSLPYNFPVKMSCLFND